MGDRWTMEKTSLSLKKKGMVEGKEGNYASSDPVHENGIIGHDLGLTLLPGLQTHRRVQNSSLNALCTGEEHGLPSSRLPSVMQDEGVGRDVSSVHIVSASSSPKNWGLCDATAVVSQACTSLTRPLSGRSSHVTEVCVGLNHGLPEKRDVNQSIWTNGVGEPENGWLAEPSQARLASLVTPTESSTSSPSSHSSPDYIEQLSTPVSSNTSSTDSIAQLSSSTSSIHHFKHSTSSIPLSPGLRRVSLNQPLNLQAHQVLSNLYCSSSQIFSSSTFKLNDTMSLLSPQFDNAMIDFQNFDFDEAFGDLTQTSTYNANQSTMTGTPTNNPMELGLMSPAIPQPMSPGFRSDSGAHQQIVGQGQHSCSPLPPAPMPPQQALAFGQLQQPHNEVGLDQEAPTSHTSRPVRVHQPAMHTQHSERSGTSNNASMPSQFPCVDKSHRAMHIQGAQHTDVPETVAIPPAFHPDSSQQQSITANNFSTYQEQQQQQNAQRSEELSHVFIPTFEQMINNKVLRDRFLGFLQISKKAAIAESTQAHQNASRLEKELETSRQMLKAAEEKLNELSNKYDYLQQFAGPWLRVLPGKGISRLSEIRTLFGIAIRDIGQYKINDAKLKNENQLLRAQIKRYTDVFRGLQREPLPQHTDREVLRMHGAAIAPPAQNTLACGSLRSTSHALSRNPLASNSANRRQQPLSVQTTARANGQPVAPAPNQQITIDLTGSDDSPVMDTGLITPEMSRETSESSSTSPSNVTGIKRKQPGDVQTAESSTPKRQRQNQTEVEKTQQDSLLGESLEDMLLRGIAEDAELDRQRAERVQMQHTFEQEKLEADRELQEHRAEQARMLKERKGEAARLSRARIAQDNQMRRDREAEENEKRALEDKKKWEAKKAREAAQQQRLELPRARQSELSRQHDRQAAKALREEQEKKAKEARVQAEKDKRLAEKKAEREKIALAKAAEKAKQAEAVRQAKLEQAEKKKARKNYEKMQDAQIKLIKKQLAAYEKAPTATTTLATAQTCSPEVAARIDARNKRELKERKERDRQLRRHLYSDESSSESASESEDGGNDDEASEVEQNAAPVDELDAAMDEAMLELFGDENGEGQGKGDDGSEDLLKDKAAHSYAYDSDSEESVEE